MVIPMSEHETNPQRPSEEQSHRPVDASPENNPERGQSDVTAQQPAVIQPAAPQSAIPLSGAPQSAIPQSGIPQSAAPQSGAPQQPGGWPGSPWQHTGQHPAPQFPHGGQPYQAAGPQQPYAGAYPGRPQYPSQGPAGLPGTWVPGGEVPPQSEVPSWAQAVGTETRQPARTGGGPQGRPGWRGRDPDRPCRRRRRRGHRARVLRRRPPARCRPATPRSPA
nr:hypothetical protein GCM10020092_014200 [Actinoplanes digitatis]